MGNIGNVYVQSQLKTTQMFTNNYVYEKSIYLIQLPLKLNQLVSYIVSCQPDTRTIYLGRGALN